MVSLWWLDCGVKRHLRLVFSEKTALHTSEKSSLHDWMTSIGSMKWSVYLSAKMYLTEGNMFYEIPFISVQSVRQDFYHGYQPWSHGPSHLKLAQMTWRDLQSFCWLCRKKTYHYSTWLVNLCQFDSWRCFIKKTFRYPIHAGIAILSISGSELWPTCCIHVLSDEPQYGEHRNVGLSSTCKNRNGTKHKFIPLLHNVFLAKVSQVAHWSMSSAAIALLPFLLPAPRRGNWMQLQ